MPYSLPAVCESFLSNGLDQNNVHVSRLVRLVTHTGYSKNGSGSRCFRLLLLFAAVVEPLS